VLVRFLWQNWGNIASLAGLIIGIVVLIVAKGAKTAAIQAREQARRRDLTEELADLARKMEQVGLFAAQRKWDIVQLRAEESHSTCTGAITRWGDQLTVGCRNKLLNVISFTRSIAELTYGPVPTEVDRLQILSTQLRTRELVDSVLGECHRIQEGTQE
jgi:hypothetical protein